MKPERRRNSIAYVFGRNQPQYRPLPANHDGETVETKWKLTWRERLKVLFGVCLYLEIKTFGKPLQPLKPTIGREP